MVKGFWTSVSAIGLAAAATVASASAANPHASAIEANWKLLENYCVECHNATDWAGGVAFDTMQPDTAADDAEIWEESVRKLRGALMPPPSKKQPDEATRAAFVQSMESFLDYNAAQKPRAGSVGLHRLNRTEYANAIEDLLGLRIDPTGLLP